MADFDLSDDQRAVRAAVREFAEKEILPYVEQYEREERYPLELIAKLPSHGPDGADDPRGVRRLVHRRRSPTGVICEELARIDWVIASVVSVSELARRGLDPAPRERRAEGALAAG